MKTVREAVVVAAHSAKSNDCSPVQRARMKELVSSKRSEEGSLKLGIRRPLLIVS